MRARPRLSVFAFSMLLLAALPATASDGVLEINQAKALAGGAGPGDAPGFPVLLIGVQTVRLTSNLDLAVAPGATINTKAIEIMNGSTSIDLNGFSISGFGAGAGGSGTGIFNPYDGSTISISNGTIRSFGAHGIDVGSGTITAVRLEANGSDGAFFFYSGTVYASTALGNGNRGFYSGGSLDAFDSISTSNGLSGFSAVNGSFHGCRATGNTSHGFNLGSGFVIASESSASTVAQVYCTGICMLTTNFFPNCGGGGPPCFAGGGTLVQLPPGSNLCGAAACP